MVTNVISKLRQLLAAQDGSIVVMGALALTSVLGMSGLAVELGNGYAAKVRNQRVADMATLGAAAAYTAYNSSGAASGSSDSQKVIDSLAAARATANDIAIANGLPSGVTTLTPDSATSPTTISVSITTSVPVKLAAIVAPGVASYNVTNAATASLASSSTISLGCITALDGSATNSVSISGSATINASNCAVAANASVYVDGSASITANTVSTAKNVTVASSGFVKATTILASGSITAPNWNSNGLQGTKRPGEAYSVSDPLSGNADLTAAFAELGQTTAPTTPSMPSAPTFPSSGTDWTFAGSDSAWTALPASDPTKTNCTKSGSAYTCNAGTYVINNLTIPGSMGVTFSGPSTITVLGTVSNSGTQLRFTGGTGSTFKFKNNLDSGSAGVVFGAGDVYVGGAANLQSTSGFGAGTITVQGALTTGGSSTVTIGAGVHSFGSITVGGSGRLTVGAGNLTVAGGITTGGSTITSFGDGTYVVGKDSNGYSLNHVGSTLTFGTGNFSGTGGIYVNGSSTLTLTAGNITIGTSNSNGAINLSGSATFNMGPGSLNADGAVTTGGSSNIVFGAGQRHNIDGNLTLNGASTLGAGRYTVNGNFSKSASMNATANDVTIIAAGTFYTGGSASLTLTAPSSNSGGGIKNIAFASLTTSGSTIEGSSSNTIGGAVYLPNSAVTLSGAGTASGATCFAMIVKTLTVTGSASSSSGCTTPTIDSSSSASGPRLIK